MQRFFSDAIPRQQELSSPCIPERKRPHSVEFRLAFKAPLFVSSYDDLGVGRRHEIVSETAQLLSKLDVVIDLTIKDHDYVSLAAVHRLASSREINDGQAPMSEADVSGFIVALAVRSAMRHGAGHTAQCVTIDSPIRVLMED